MVGVGAVHSESSSSTGDSNGGDEVDRPDGFGHWGRLDVVDDDEHVVCHECGHPCRSLGAHAHRAHAMSAESYRAQHGLPPDTCLAAPRTRRRVPRT